MRTKSLAAVVLCILAFSVFSVCLSADAVDSSSVFYDSFEGSEVDTSKWQVQEQNLNMTSYPAWGGNIEVADGSLQMSSNGSTFPFIQTLQNPFPATGDFAIQFNLTYTAIGDWGAGLMIGNGTPSLDPVGIGYFVDYVWHNRIFTLWAHDKGTPEQSMIYIELFNKMVYEMDYSGFRPSTPSHLYKLTYTQGVYHVYVDGVEVAQTTSDVRPTTILIGEPPIPELPHSPENTAQWMYWGWSSFKVEYIHMLQWPQISFSATSQTSQIGSKINILGSLRGEDNATLSNETVNLFYTIPGVSSWYPVAAAVTDSGGVFSATWFPPANGEFSLKAEWSGNEEYVGASVEKNVSVLSNPQENVFFAESNSTLSSLSFNSTSKEISFTVSGPSGTTGYVRFVIPKTLMPTLDFKVYMDGKELNFTASSVDDSYVLYFEYSHSMHTISIVVPAVVTPELQTWILMPLLAIAALILVAAKKSNLFRR